MNCKQGEVDLFLFEVNLTLIEYKVNLTEEEVNLIECESRKVSEYGCIISPKRFVDTYTGIQLAASVYYDGPNSIDLMIQQSII
jgi:hypothetical protein